MEYSLDAANEFMCDEWNFKLRINVDSTRISRRIPIYFQTLTLDNQLLGFVVLQFYSEFRSITSHEIWNYFITSHRRVIFIRKELFNNNRRFITSRSQLIYDSKLRHTNINAFHDKCYRYGEVSITEEYTRYRHTDVKAKYKEKYIRGKIRLMGGLTIAIRDFYDDNLFLIFYSGGEWKIVGYFNNTLDIMAINCANGTVITRVNDSYFMIFNRGANLARIYKGKIISIPIKEFVLEFGDPRLLTVDPDTFTIIDSNGRPDSVAVTDFSQQMYKEVLEDCNKTMMFYRYPLYEKKIWSVVESYLVKSYLG